MLYYMLIILIYDVESLVFFKLVTHVCELCAYKIGHSFACQPFTRAAMLLEADTQHIDEREKLGVRVDQRCVTSWPSGVSQL